MAGLNCDVCGTGATLGVACVPGLPISVAYCEDCLRAGAHPYETLVIATADLGGLDDSADWWKEMVQNTLKHLKIPWSQFFADVDEAIADFIKMEQEMEREMQKGGSSEAGPPTP